MTNFQRMDVKNQEQRKVKEKVVLKDFLNKGSISLHPVILTISSLHRKTIKVIIISMKNTLDFKLSSRIDT